MNEHDLALLRQGTYRLLGTGFALPEPEAINRTIDSIEVLAEFGLFDFAFSLPLTSYAETLARADLGELVTSYMALFEVGAGGAACPPTESAWLANPWTGDVAVILSKLRRTYLSFGRRPTGPWADTIDHATVELHVMASLCDDHARRIESGKPTERVLRHQSELLNEHLNRWMPRFTAAVISSDRHPTYSALARATHAFLVHDTDLLTLLERNGVVAGR